MKRINVESKRFCCFVVGSGAIALSCVNVLLSEGHSILGVYSFDGALRAWADTEKIPHAESKDDFREVLFSQKFDFLFSINNPWVIPADVLALASCRNINFHDSPLPKYAGLHATSWALINGETEHATTWHEMEVGIDRGRILKQRSFCIESSDTASTVNRRVLKLTLDTFSELVGELALGTEQAVEQPLDKSSYYSLKDRPAAACLITPNSTYQECYNLIRGLDFGSAPNPLGKPKLMLTGGPIVVCGVTLLTQNPKQSLGLIDSVSAEGLTVSISDSVVMFTGLCSLSGKVLSPNDLKALGVKQGEKLPIIPQSCQSELSLQDSEAAIRESFWLNRLLKVIPFNHPYCDGNNNYDQSHRYLMKELAFVSNFQEQLLGIFAAYLARLASEEYFNVGLVVDDQTELVRQFFATVVPIQISLVDGNNEPYGIFQQRFTKELKLGIGARISLDLMSRHSIPNIEQDWPQLPVVIALWDSPAAVNEALFEASLGLFCFRDGSVPELFHSGGLEKWQCEFISKQLGAFSAAVATSNDEFLSRLPIVTPDERACVLYHWNDTKTPYPDDKTVDALIALQAEANPEALAVKFGDDSITYRELEQRANQIGSEIRRMGSFSGSPVLLCLPRCIDQVVALLGIIKSGSAYVPIDPSYPSERIKHIIKDSGSACVITHSTFKSQWFSSMKNVIALDLDGECLYSRSSDRISSDVSVNSPLYVIYTSGSTGQPKGVSISHQSLVNHSWAIAKKYELGLNDKVLQSASISFDVAAEQIFPTLFSGSTVVIRPDNLFESFIYFETFILKNKLTVLILPTAFWHEWVVDLSTEKRFVPESIKVVGVGTEKVLGNRLNSFMQQCHQSVAFHQGYGPTEATITCTMYSHQAEGAFADQEIPIGPPLPNVELYVLDQNLEPVPVGVNGELFIGGPGVAIGYHRQEELTKEKFIANPFKLKKLERLYRTGDLVRWARDGQLIFAGRNDLQVKIRGMRIELGEIEALLVNHKAVNQAVCKVFDHGRSGKVIIAYVTPHSLEIERTDLHAYLEKNLPRYMVPAHIVTQARFPITPNGKVDLRSLAFPASIASKKEGCLPVSDSECDVAQVWQEMLGVDQVYLDDNFFDVGGDSLLAIRMVDRINRHLSKKYNFSKKISAASIFDFPTVRSLTAFITQNKEELKAKSSIVNISTIPNSPAIYFINSTGIATKMAEYLSPKLGIHSLNIFNLTQRFFDSESESDSLVHDIATIMAEDLLDHQPFGNFRLAGYCQDGLLTIEVANALMSKGRNVDFVGLYDVIFEDDRPISIPQRFRMVRDLNISYIVEKTQIAIKRLTKKMRSSHLPGLGVPIESLHSKVLLDIKFYERYLEEASVGVPEYFDGVIDLFLCLELRFKALRSTHAIARKGLNIHRIKTAHHDTFAPKHIKETATLLSSLVLAREGSELMANNYPSKIANKKSFT